MVKFRFHKGGLAESMQTAIDVKSKGDIAKAFNDKFNACILASDLECSYYAYDERIKWDTYLVTHRGSAIGFANGDLK